MTADDCTPGRGQDGDGQDRNYRVEGASEVETARASLSSVSVDATEYEGGGEVSVRGYRYDDDVGDVVLTVGVGATEVVLSFAPEQAVAFARAVDEAAEHAAGEGGSR